MNKHQEIVWLRQWLKKESKREWVPWMKPIIAANRKRLKQLSEANQ